MQLTVCHTMSRTTAASLSVSVVESKEFVIVQDLCKKTCIPLKTKNLHMEDTCQKYGLNDSKFAKITAPLKGSVTEFGSLGSTGGSQHHPHAKLLKLPEGRSES